MTENQQNQPESAPEFAAPEFAELEDWAQELPQSIRGKLKARRYDALEKAFDPARKSTKLSLPGWLRRYRLHGISITGIAAVILVSNATLTSDSIHDLPQPDDISLLSDNEELDLLEDMEFIQWLSEQDSLEKG